jgi:hypothetical protein
MKIVSDQTKIKRYGKIGLYTSLASLVLLVAAVALTLTFKPEFTTYSFIAMLAGLVLSQIGVFFANRWGKSPRVDESLSQGLKGLDDRYTLYHYMGPVPHLLAGPTGLWVIVPEYQSGTITYENNCYRQQGVRFMSRMIGQEGLGNPESEARSYREDMLKYLKKTLPEEQQPPVQSVIVFTNPKASVQAQEAPIPTMHVEKLKDFLRRKVKEAPVSLDKIQEVVKTLPTEDR